MRSCIFSIIPPVFSVTWSSEIIIICGFAAQETFLIIIKVEKLWCTIFLWYTIYGVSAKKRTKIYIYNNNNSFLQGHIQLIRSDTVKIQFLNVKVCWWEKCIIKIIIQNYKCVMFIIMFLEWQTSILEWFKTFVFYFYTLCQGVDEVLIPLSPSLAIFRRSMKCVPMATSFTLSESRTWIFILRHSGGNCSVKTICSFQIGS